MGQTKLGTNLGPDIEDMIGFSKHCLEKDGELQPFIEAMTAEKRLLIPLDFGSNVEKDWMARMCKVKFKELNVLSYIYCSEAWMVNRKIDSSGFPNVIPSEEEDKIEVLMIQKVTGTHVISIYHKMVRDSAGKFKDLELFEHSEVARSTHGPDAIMGRWIDLIPVRDYTDAGTRIH